MGWRILIQGQVCSELVVIVFVGRKDPAQMRFAEDDKVIEAFPADAGPLRLSPDSYPTTSGRVAGERQAGAAAPHHQLMPQQNDLGLQPGPRLER